MQRLTTIEEFRKRIRYLLATHFDGQYTQLARRAGLPVSTMQHYIHAAKHLPGGEHAVKLATALGVTVDYLLTGTESVRPWEVLAHPIVLVQARSGRESIELDRHVAVPVFTCRCPTGCPFSHEIPPVDQTQERVVVPEDLVANRHRLVGLRITGPLEEGMWRKGSRLIVDWDARKADWSGTFLVREGGRCKLARLHRIAEHLLLSPPNGGTTPPHQAAEDTAILGRLVAGVHPL